MGIKFDKAKEYYIISVSARHPITRKPLSRKRVGIKSLAEAKRIHASLLMSFGEELKRFTCPTWNIFLDEYLEYCRSLDLSLGTISNRELSLKAHTLKEWNGKFLDQITTLDIRNIINIKLKDSSLSLKKDILKYIRGCLEYGVEKDYIKRNPVPRIKFKLNKKVKTVLTKSEVKTLLLAAKQFGCTWYPIWAAALYTGLRNGELYALTWDKVNFEQRCILVNVSWHRTFGFKSTKSGNDRFIEIAPELLSILRELKLQNINSNYVLPRLDAWDRGEQARELRWFLEANNLPRIRFHDLRATWCTLMLQHGVESVKLMKMGGWETLATMERYIRQAGVDIKGITNNFELHNHSIEGKLLQLEQVE
jgi:integrase